jgi:hypothetical protein
MFGDVYAKNEKTKARKISLKKNGGFDQNAEIDLLIVYHQCIHHSPKM